MKKSDFSIHHTKLVEADNIITSKGILIANSQYTINREESDHLLNKREAPKSTKSLQNSKISTRLDRNQTCNYLVSSQNWPTLARRTKSELPKVRR